MRCIRFFFPFAQFFLSSLSNSTLFLNQSAVSPEFWAALGAAKLDEWKLSEEPRDIYGKKQSKLFFL